ncbi:MAG: LacI family DNA-binding transcriptional regulator [Psychroflexus sp.]|nr:LacI family DNA-binding transcriptional regulator [Psychroflexus sp.]MDR9449555.1 LacI family DNA-binding transcriptional regulator [Psychroflexus sp.]
MKPKASLKMIATELDVSVSTVSKALKDSKEISDSTKKKIKAFAKLYNYKPNNIALSLKNQQTNNIGVIIPEIVHHFFTTVIFGIEKYANEHGYNVIIGLSNESFKKEVINLDMLANGSIDGFILSVAKETLFNADFHHFEETIDQGLPIVMFDRVLDNLHCDTVVVDDVKASKDAVRCLMESGCKKIGIITTEDFVNVGKKRYEGYKAFLHENNLPFEERYALKVNDAAIGQDNEQKLETMLYSYFRKNPDIDGIYAVNEFYAVTAMKVARDLGYAIPKDIQFIGFTDGVLSKHAYPPLTTISQPGEKMGEKVAELLIRRMKSQHKGKEVEPTRVVVDTKIIHRETTKA